VISFEGGNYPVLQITELDSGEYGFDVRTESGNVFKAVTVTRRKCCCML